MIKTASLVLFSLLALTLLLSTVFSSGIRTANAQENSVIATGSQPPPAGNKASQSLVCINNQCHTTTCIDNQCQTTVNNGRASSSTSDQQIQTNTAPPTQYDGIRGNTFSQSQSNICTNNGCHTTTCIDNQCQTTVNNGRASSSTSDQQIQTNIAPPPQ
jgi:hypothetical protein